MRTTVVPDVKPDCSESEQLSIGEKGPAHPMREEAHADPFDPTHTQGRQAAAPAPGGGDQCVAHARCDGRGEHRRHRTSGREVGVDPARRPPDCRHRSSYDSLVATRGEHCEPRADIPPALMGREA